MPGPRARRERASVSPSPPAAGADLRLAAHHRRQFRDVYLCARWGRDRLRQQRHYPPREHGQRQFRFTEFLRLPSVPAGKHVVTFVQTSDGAYGLSIVGIGSGAPRAGDEFPTVLVGTIPSQLPGNRCNSSHGACQHYIDDIQADVNLLAADGLKVRLFDTRTFMFGTPLEMNDPVHPNNTGTWN